MRSTARQPRDGANAFVRVDLANGTYEEWRAVMGTVGIRVNAVAPGPVETDMAKLVHSVAIRSDYHDVIPLKMAAA